jgi:small-conductance mechanosensitive channel
MDHWIENAAQLLQPGSAAGACFYGVVFLALASLAAWLIRRGAHRVERGLSNVTVLQFVSVFAQLLAYLVAFVLYAHLVPPLRALGTALLAGASVVSVVVGLAAQDTLGNLIAGFSLVLSRTIQIGDGIRLYCPVGTISARVREISLGFSLLVDADGNEVVVPNSVMMNSAIVRIGDKVAVSSAAAPEA